MKTNEKEEEEEAEAAAAAAVAAASSNTKSSNMNHKWTASSPCLEHVVAPDQAHRGGGGNPLIPVATQSLPPSLLASSLPSKWLLSSWFGANHVSLQAPSWGRLDFLRVPHSPPSVLPVLCCHLLTSILTLHLSVQFCVWVDAVDTTPPWSSSSWHSEAGPVRDRHFKKKFLFKGTIKKAN